MPSIKQDPNSHGDPLIVQCVANRERDRLLLLSKHSGGLSLTCCALAADGRLAPLGAARPVETAVGAALWLSRRLAATIASLPGGPELRWYSLEGDRWAEAGAARLGMPGQILRAQQVDGEILVLFAISTPQGLRFGLFYPASRRYRLLTEPHPGASLGAWRPDQRLLALNAPLPAAGDRPCGLLIDYADGSQRVIDLAALGAATPIGTAVNAVRSRALLAVTVDAPDQTHRLALFDPESGARTWLNTAGAQIERASFDPATGRVCCVELAEADWRTTIHSPTGALLGQVESSEALVNELIFCRDPRYLLVSYQTPQQPPALGRYELATRRLTPVYPTPQPGLPPLHTEHRRVAVVPEPALPVWRFSPDRQARPTVIYLHGGPHVHSSKAYSPLIARLVASGFTVIAPNFPGSTGYGPEHRRSLQGDWGGIDLRGIIGLAERLRAEEDQPLLLYGVSYGGYLSLLAAGQRPDLWTCAVAATPVTDLADLYATAGPAMRRQLDVELGALCADSAALAARSPISWADGLAQLPLLLIHGDQDTICPIRQSRRLAELLRARPSPCAPFIYAEIPELGHELYAERHWSDQVFDFMVQHTAVPAWGAAA